MANFYNSVPQGRFVQASPAMSDPREVQSVQPAARAVGTNVSMDLASREYADASRALAMAQINLGNKPKYCSVPIGYNR